MTASEIKHRIRRLRLAIASLDREMQSHEHQTGARWIDEVAAGTMSHHVLTGSYCRHAQDRIDAHADLTARLARAEQRLLRLARR